jgi:hypothetical protein
MAHEDQALISLGTDYLDGGVQFLVILGEVRGVTSQLPLPQRPAVAAQIECVEVIPPPREGIGQVGLEEVVAPAVDIQHRAP